MTSDEAGDFREVLAEYVPNDSDFYRRVCKAYDVLNGVRSESDGEGHGVTLVLPATDEVSSELEDALEDAVPYNGRPHSLYDPDIEQVVQHKRELDGALFVGPDNQISYAGLELQIGTSKFKRKYGVSRETNINELLGFRPDEDPVGMRNRSALYSSHRDVFGESVAILTLGESGEINLYYCGDRVYNSAGRKMHWELASRPPASYAKVVPFDIARTRLVPDNYSEDRAVYPAAAGDAA